MNKVNYVLLAALSISIGVAAYFAGKSGNEPSAVPVQPQAELPQTGKTEPEQAIPKKPNKEATLKPAITPEVVAKAKNVPAKIKDPKGDYTLVTVVEGVEANRRFNQSLQVVAAQHRSLAALSRKLNNTPTDSVQQRKSITDKIKESKKTLEKNLSFMAKTYSYSLKNTYVKVTHEALLLSVNEDTGEANTERIYEFKTAEDYENFQKKRDAYIRLKRELTKAAKKDGIPAAVLVKEGAATPVPKPDLAVEPNTKLTPTPEMVEKRKELQQVYKYDTEKKYLIRLMKTALYARPAHAPQAKKPIPKKPVTKKPRPRVMTPADIAKAKNVSATLKDPKGDYTLVAVVEGGGANGRLSQGLQIIDAQRKRLGLFTQQFNRVPINSVQQRELIAGQINETKKALNDNIRILAQKYGYSLKNQYEIVPYVASLVSITEVAGELKPMRVHVFKTPEEFKTFQKKNNAYLLLLQAQLKAARAARKKVKPAPTAKMKEMQKELVALYKYDPEKSYKISIDKSVLYSRPAR